MSQLSLWCSSSDAASLLVREVAGSYRPAEPAEVLQAALRVLAGQVWDTEVLSSPQVVRLDSLYWSANVDTSAVSEVVPTAVRTKS